MRRGLATAKTPSREAGPSTAPCAGADSLPAVAPALTRRHLRLGWWMVLVFLTLGIGLEMMHGFKIGWYLDVSNETRRLMWRLAHAHGVLVGVLHIAFALTHERWPAPPGRWQLASRALIAGGFLLPGGFLLGGLAIHEGDPGLGILLVPAGAALLFLAVLFTALACRARA